LVQSPSLTASLLYRYCGMPSQLHVTAITSTTFRHDIEGNVEEFYLPLFAAVLPSTIGRKSEQKSQE